MVMLWLGVNVNSSLMPYHYVIMPLHYNIYLLTYEDYKPHAQQIKTRCSALITSSV